MHGGTEHQGRMFERILVVCVGNICRSPMAAALLRRELASRERVRVSSAGIAALSDRPADPIAQELMSEKDIDISAHRARQLTSRLLQVADLVLVMESDQRNEVMRMEPSSRGKVFCLGHWTSSDIPDPYKQPREAFEEALRLIEQGISEWLPRL